ncbi:MAG TPA: hypothetical protein VHC69_12780 [Polyangiaceae bacterium]|nr:hypothetical protein [Polyangiaceae bacterium]
MCEPFDPLKPPYGPERLRLLVVQQRTEIAEQVEGGLEGKLARHGSVTVMGHLQVGEALSESQPGAAPGS